MLAIWIVCIEFGRIALLSGKSNSKTKIRFKALSLRPWLTRGCGYSMHFFASLVAIMMLIC